jgi:hypothetical protein
MPPSIQKKKALIKGLGVAIFSKTKLLLEVHTKGTALVSVRATQHENAKVFVTDGFNGLYSYGIGRIFGIIDYSELQMLLFET